MFRLLDTISKTCITAMFIILYLHTFHIKCAGMFTNHLHTKFHMPCYKCSLVTTIKLKTQEKFNVATMLLIYNLKKYYRHKSCIFFSKIYYYISLQVHKNVAVVLPPPHMFEGLKCPH